MQQKKSLNSEVYRVLHDACKKEVVKVYVKFIWNDLYWSLFFNKVVGRRREIF